MDGGPDAPELKESDPVDRAEKDFWKIIEEEKRKRDRKTVLVRKFSPPYSLIQSPIFFSQGDEKAAAEEGAAVQTD